MVAGYSRRSARGSQVIRRRVMQLVHVVVPVCRQCETPAGRVPEPTAERKCKGGAEAVWVILHRTTAAGDAETKVHHRNEVMKSFLPGEIERQIYVVQVDRDVVATELSAGARFLRIDRHASRAYVRPTRHHVRRPADVNLVAKPEQRAILRGDANRVLSRRVMAVQESELLRVLELPVRAFSWTVFDLNFSCSI